MRRSAIGTVSEVYFFGFALLIVFAPFLSGCNSGGKGSGFGKEMEAKIKEKINKDATHLAAIPITDIECPNDIEKKTGASFRCTTENKEMKVTGAVEITFTSDNGDFTYKYAR